MTHDTFLTIGDFRRSAVVHKFLKLLKASYYNAPRTVHFAPADIATLSA